MTQPKFIGPHGHGFEDVANCLAAYRDETIVFVHNPGNAGDNIINLGTYRIFDRIGIKYVTGVNDEVYRDRVIVYSGGGCLVPHYPGADTFFRRNHPVCKAMILLPHTIRTHADLISQMDERCHLFAREEPSHEFVRQHVNRAHIYKAHDMAFLLDKEYIEEIGWGISDLYRKSLFRSWLVMLVKFSMVAKFRDSTLYSFRTDHESDSQPTHPLNYDMSNMFATADMRLTSCKNTAKALNSVLSAFRHIKTDRLHVAIFSAILGLDVEMHDNNYGKNHDIYVHSIQDRFDNVRFVARSHGEGGALSPL